MNTLSQSSKKWMIVCTIMLVAILEVLDSTIVNVALPNMMPSLSADQSQITWVLTSYVVAAAMMLPLTGFLSNQLGTKKLLIIDIIGFMISSCACGVVNDLTLMVFFRLLQGGFGAALIPLSQAILRDSFTPEEQPTAMAIWGLGIMAAPVFGPTLGGYIVAHASWRWIFYLNVPICFLGLIMAFIYIPEFEKKPRKIDHWGILLMFLSIGSLQIFLDQGNEKSWFHSNEIMLLALISTFCAFLFLFRSKNNPASVITLKIFKDRNFSVCTLLLAMYCGSLFGFITLEPIMLENLFHYTPMLAGETMITLGAASAVAMSFSSPLMKKIKVKYILIASLIITSLGAFYFSHLSLNATQNNFRIGNAFFGFGLGLFMVPLTTYSLATLPQHHITEAAGLFTYGRMLGTSIGVSLLSTLISRETQINWEIIGSHINNFNQNLPFWLQSQHTTLQNSATLVKLQSTIAAQAGMLAFLDGYEFIAVLLLALIPLALCLKNVTLTSTEIIGH